MQSNPSTVATSGDLSESRTAIAGPALIAAFLGAFIVWGVGFAGPSVIHNVAHDTRHSAAFPCH